MERNFIIILKEFLDGEEMTQTQFAERIKVKPSQVSEWLHGKAKPGYDTLKKMVLEFEVSADYFLGIVDTYYP